MEIVSYSPEQAAAVSEAYNRAVLGVPHCYPAGAEDFAEVARGACGGPPPHARVHDEAAFVARDGAEVLGFVHVGVETPKHEDGAAQGVMPFFFYERGRRAVGQALLEQAEAHLRDAGLTRLEAFRQDYRYWFYHWHHALLSIHLDHVHALLGFNGYTANNGEIYFDWPNYEPPSACAPDADVALTFAWRQGRGRRPEIIVRAVHDGTEAGVCECLSGGASSRAPEAQDWFLVSRLNVIEPLQGRKIGAHMLQRALREMYLAGYRHTAISTAWDNYRAFVFYSNYGWRVVDRTYAFERVLG